MGIGIIGLGFVALYSIVVYNQLIRRKMLIEEAYAGIDVQLQLRYDLVPMLVEVVKATRLHESSTLKEVIELRSRGMSGTLSVEALGKNEVALSRALARLMVNVENYPELRTNQNFLELQTQLVDIEDLLGEARRYYNATVRYFNIYKQQFPNVLIANLFRFSDGTYFAVSEDNARKSPGVSLS
ncbi:MAG: LemA family protein [Xanthomonadaceae bacterium]|nr:LemA family protein [Xanthomonadaceae bacterium]